MKSNARRRLIVSTAAALLLASCAHVTQDGQAVLSRAD